MKTEQEQKKQERTWWMLCHLSALCMFLGIPFGNIIGPLLIWLVKKDDMPSIVEHGKEAVNFQITMTLYLIGAGILCIILIGIPLLIGLFIMQIVLTIVASIKIANGESYRYPLTLRLIQ